MKSFISFCCLAIILSTQNLSAQEFRIETVIYAGDSKKPIAQNLTLFTESAIYDFRMSDETPPRPAEIVIFDLRQKDFSLVDVTRGMRTKIQGSELIQMVEGLRQQIKIDSKTKFLVEDMQETLNQSGNEMRLENSEITYRFQGRRPSNPNLLPNFYEYLNQYTRLMASDPLSLPPFARMQMNDSIKKLGWFPTEIEANYKANKLLKNAIRMKSKHEFLESLSDKDRERILSAKNLLMKSQPVSLPIYRGLTPRTASK